MQMVEKWFVELDTVMVIFCWKSELNWCFMDSKITVMVFYLQYTAGEFQKDLNEALINSQAKYEEMKQKVQNINIH